MAIQKKRPTQVAMNILTWPVKLISALFQPLQDLLDESEEARFWLNIMRLGMFQFGVGLSIAPITGTLNRVLIDDLRISAVAVSVLISIHYFVSPVRAIIGHRSDVARSEGKWRTPYLVFGVMFTYGGLASAPFALLLLGGNGYFSFWPAFIICFVIFLAYGAGINMVETIFLALVSDITPPKERGKVLAILWVMLILGTVVSAMIISRLLVDYSHTRLIQVMQGSAVWFIVFTVFALFKQERLNPDGSIVSDLKLVKVRTTLWESVKALNKAPVVRWLFVAVFLATMGFATHDVLLEPYGGQVLGMSVAETMQLTVIWGMATIIGVLLAGLLLWRFQAPSFLIAAGCTVGLIGFGIISFASNVEMVLPFKFGVFLISGGRGIFLVGSIILIMSLTDVNHAGFFIGIWGIVQGIAQGFGVIGGGLMRDIVQTQTGSVVQGYTLVYATSLILLLIVVLMLVLWLGRKLKVDQIRMPWSGLDEIPADQLVF